MCVGSEHDKCVRETVLPLPPLLLSLSPPSLSRRRRRRCWCCWLLGLAVGQIPERSPEGRTHGAHPEGQAAMEKQHTQCSKITHVCAARPPPKMRRLWGGPGSCQKPFCS